MWHTPCWSTYTWVHLGRFVGRALWALSKSAVQMRVRPGCSLRNWDFKVKSGDVFWALFQTDNPNSVGYSHQWCTRVLVYMHPRTSEVICWFWSSLCKIDLQQDFESCYKLNLGAPLFFKMNFSQKKIGQMFTCWD